MQLTAADVLANDGKYLAALAAVEKEMAGATPERRSMLRQSQAMLLAFCGDEAGAQATFAQAFPGRPETKRRPLPAGSRAEDARKAVLTAARDRQVVILNEAHHISRHRAFGLSLLADLKRLGFTHFAAEALKPPAALERSLASGAVTYGTGYYTRDPVFAAYVREARRLGMALVSYETENFSRTPDPIVQINQREVDQARNLYERIFQKTPDARAFVHVGFSHAVKEPVRLGEGELLWMAGRLRRLLGTDPLTIDQTEGTAPCAWDLRGLRRSSVVWAADGAPLAAGDANPCDLSVFHPAAALRHGRPEWLLALPGRRAHPIPPGSGRRLVQAFRVGEPEDAIAWDQVLALPDAPPPVLALPPGRYRLVVQDEAGESRSRGEIAL